MESVFPTAGPGLGSERRWPHIYPGGGGNVFRSRASNVPHRFRAKHSLWRCDFSNECASFKSLGNLSRWKSSAPSAPKEPGVPAAKRLCHSTLSSEAHSGSAVECEHPAANRLGLVDHCELCGKYDASPSDGNTIEPRHLSRS